MTRDCPSSANIVNIFGDGALMDEFLKIKAKFDRDEPLSRLEKTILKKGIEAHMNAVAVDFKTGLLNEHAMLAQLDLVLENSRGTRASRYPNKHLFLYIDLNKFKSINDAYGHSHGDKMLLATGKYLRRSFQSSDDVARLHGDEFAVIMYQNLDVNEKNQDDLEKRLKELSKGLKFKL